MIIITTIINIIIIVIIITIYIYIYIYTYIYIYKYIIYTYIHTLYDRPFQKELFYLGALMRNFLLTNGAVPCESELTVGALHDPWQFAKYVTHYI